MEWCLMKYKKMITIILLFIFVVTTFFLIKEYNSYRYTNDLKIAYKKYNSVQKKCDVVGTSQNYLYLKRNKSDFSFKEGLANSKWKLKNKETGKEYTFQTKEDGYGGIVGVENGVYTLEEISTPKSEEKLSCKKTIIFDKSNSSYELKMSSSMKSSILYVYTHDLEGNVIDNITYEIYDSEYHLKKQFFSTSGGMIYSSIEDGIYYVRNVEYNVYFKVEVRSCEEADVHFIVRREL